MELETALPTTTRLRCWALHARHLDQASPWLVARNAKSARLDPSRLRLSTMAVFSTFRGGLTCHESALSEMR